MRYIYRTTILLACICALANLALGGTYNVPGTNVTLSYDVRVNEVAIIDCNENASGAFSIPATINGMPVTTIDYYAFDYCYSITQVTLPGTLEVIQSGAFVSCVSLEEITFPASVVTIGDYAFSDSGLKFAIFEGNAPNNFGNQVFSGLGALFIIYFDEGANGFSRPSWQGYQTELLPSSALSYRETSLGYTITDCANSASGDLYIPKTIRGKIVKQIGTFAFEGCASLTSIEIPRYVDSISNFAFSGCTNLVDFTVDENSTRFSDIGGVLFNKLQTELIAYPPGRSGSYSVPSGISAIDGYAFYFCDSLDMIQLPEEMSIIDGRAFTNCSSLMSINVAAGNPSLASVGGVLYDKGITTIIAYPEGKSATSFVFPGTVSTIGNSAFDYCGSLTELIIPDTIKRIEWGAFQGCSSLLRVEIPGSVRTVEDVAFNVCSSLSEAIFVGSAPDNFGQRVFDLAAQDFSVNSYEDVSGFSYPTWNGYQSIMLSRPDSDDDNWPDYLEELLGTESDNPQDYFRTWMTTDPNGSTKLHYEPHSDLCLFVVEWTSDLGDEESWETLNNGTFNGELSERSMTLDVSEVPSKFYRIVVSENPNL